MQFTIFVTSFYKNVCFLFVYDREYKTYVQVNKPLLKMYTLTIRWCFYDIWVLCLGLYKKSWHLLLYTQVVYKAIFVIFRYCRLMYTQQFQTIHIRMKA